MKIEGTFTIEPVITVISAAIGGVGGAIYGGIAGMLMPPEVRRCFRALAPLTRAQCARMGAREFSAIIAALFGFESMMRGKDDLKSRLVSASGAALAFSFVRQGFKVRPAPTLSYTAAFTVMSGTLYKMNEIDQSKK